MAGISSRIKPILYCPYCGMQDYEGMPLCLCLLEADSMEAERDDYLRGKRAAYLKRTRKEAQSQ